MLLGPGSTVDPATLGGRVGRVQMATTRFTTAPESYDGFGTKTVTRFKARRNGLEYVANFREVEVNVESLDWQRGRYGSGNYQCLAHHELELLFTRVL